jgi:hypothetical protein
MPAILDQCVKKLMRQGKTKSQAFAICSKTTGWKKGKKGKWIKRKKK